MFAVNPSVVEFVGHTLSACPEQRRIKAMSEPCPVCKGSGQVSNPAAPLIPAPGSDRRNCHRCGASGKVDGLRAGEVSVPADEVRPLERGGFLD